jgi:hypothetical protein
MTISPAGQMGNITLKIELGFLFLGGCREGNNAKREG